MLDKTYYFYGISEPVEQLRHNHAVFTIGHVMVALDAKMAAESVG